MFQLVSYCSKLYNTIDEAKANRATTTIYYDIDPGNISLRDFDNITDLLNINSEWTKCYLHDVHENIYYDIRQLYFIASVYEFSSTRISLLEKTRSVFMTAPGDNIEMVCQFTTTPNTKYGKNKHTRVLLIPSNSSYRDVLYMAQKLRNKHQNCNVNFSVGLRSNGSFISLDELKDYTLNGLAWVDASSAHIHTMNCISSDIYNEIFMYN